MSEVPSSPRSSVSGTTARRVLIAEDETIVGMGLRAQVEKLGHAVAGQAADPTQAVTMFEQFSPDLVLMDIRLSESDGIELSGRLLARRRCPIVIISAYSDDALHTLAAAAGVFGYLIKPVSEKSLAAQIAVAVRRFSEAESLR